MRGIDRDRPVCLVCAGGHRSGAMAGVLDKAGLDVVNVLEGARGRVASGRPVTPREGGVTCRP